MKTCFISLVAFIAVFGATSTRAQIKPDVRLGLYTNGGNFSAGGGVAIPIPVPSFGKLVINPMVEYLFVSNVTTIFGHVDLAYAFELPKSPIAPWAGAGLLIAYSNLSIDVPDFGGARSTQSSSQTNVGFNLFGGVGFPINGIMPYAQAKLLISNGTNFQISGGVRF